MTIPYESSSGTKHNSKQAINRRYLKPPSRDIQFPAGGPQVRLPEWTMDFLMLRANCSQHLFEMNLVEVVDILEACCLDIRTTPPKHQMRPLSPRLDLRSTAMGSSVENVWALIHLEGIHRIARTTPFWIPKGGVPNKQLDATSNSKTCLEIHLKGPAEGFCDHDHCGWKPEEPSYD